jgi:hypothetical protein
VGAVSVICGVKTIAMMVVARNMGAWMDWCEIVSMLLGQRQLGALAEAPKAAAPPVTSYPLSYLPGNYRILK